MDENMKDNPDYYLDEEDDPELTGEFFEDSYREDYREARETEAEEESAPIPEIPEEEDLSADLYSKYDDEDLDEDERPTRSSRKQNKKEKRKSRSKGRKTSKKNKDEESKENFGLKTNLLTNPVIRSVLKKNVTAHVGQKTVTPGGVLGKCIFFLICTAIGMAACACLHQFVDKIPNLSETMLGVFILNLGPFSLNAKTIELLVFISSVALTGLLAIVNIFARPLIPVTGTIYCLAEGYFLAFITSALKEEYRWVGIAALTLTILLVLIMLFLFKSGTVRLGGKILRVIVSIFLTVAIGGALLFAMKFIPGLNMITHGIDLVLAKPAIAGAISAVSIILACLFLLADFEAIGKAVDSNMVKKYEWQLAFGIAYVVFFLYLKIFDLILKIFAREK